MQVRLGTYLSGEGPALMFTLSMMVIAAFFLYYLFRP
jgi:hypothetical protein